MENLKVNQAAMLANQKAIAEFMFTDSKASFIEFLLEMQQDFLITNAEKGEEGYVDRYVQDCLFDFKTLITFISKLEHPYEFIERVQTAA